MRSELGVVDLFCGAGGLAEGFRQAGGKILAGSDIDPDACATFALNFPGARTVAGDLRERAIRRALLDAATGADIVVGGPPCQAFSQVRNHARLIEDPRNSLYREFVRIVAEVEPRVFVMENVVGMQQMGVKEQVLEDLALKGAYRVRAQILDAANFGVPQTRQRIVFIGVHRSLATEPPVLRGSGATSEVSLVRRNGSARIRYGLWGPTSFLKRLHDPEDTGLITAGQAISDLSFLRAGSLEDAIEVTALPEPESEYQRKMRIGLRRELANVSVPGMREDTRLRLSKLPPGGNHRDLPAAMLERYLTGALWGPSNGTGRLGRRHYYAYRRLHPDCWSWTLNTKADSVYHYSAKRALSVREFARLQSFPDRFVFVTDPRRGPIPGRIEGGAGHSRYRQVGNAVPPLLAKAIAVSVMAVLSKPARNAAAV